MRSIIAVIITLFLIILPLDVFAQLSEPTTQRGKISLDIKGMDIIDALKLLSKQADLNIVAGKNVRGKVTLFLKDVDPWFAFQVILAANDLAYEEENGIITVMAERDYELMYGEKFNVRQQVKTVKLRYAKAAEVSKALTQIKSKVGAVIIDENTNTLIIKDTPASIAQMIESIKELDTKTDTKVYDLNYAVAEKVKEKLGNTISKAGTIDIDERTNKLIVTDTPRKIKEADKLVKELDEKTKQVLIETKIIQIDLDDDYKLGVNWDKFFGELTLGSSFQAITSAISPTSSGTTGGVFKLGNLDKDTYQATVRALETLGRTNTLSSPRVVTTNNEEAKILVGTNQPYATSTTTTPATGSAITSYQITYLDLGVKLHVTPTINEDGFITMKIKPEVSSSTSNYSYGSPTTNVPIVKTSQVETTVMVKDGTTIVLAGLMESRDEEDVNKVPILGDIPILGGLFRSRTKGSTSLSEKTELVIFITPRVITGDVHSEEVEEYTDMVYDLETKYDDEEFFKQKKKIGLTPEEEEEIDKLVEDKFTDFEATKKKPEDRNIHITKEVVEEEVPKLVKEPVYSAAPTVVSRTGGYAEASKEYQELVRNQVHELINQRLDPLLKGEVFVEFTILYDGSLKDEPRILRSSNDDLKDLTIVSILQASPYPPFPKEVTAREKTYKILISY